MRVVPLDLNRARVKCKMENVKGLNLFHLTFSILQGLNFSREEVEKI
jgi:hypothetical protein